MGNAELDRSLLQAKVMQRNGYPYLIHPLMDGVPRVPARLIRAWVAWAAQQRDVLSRATLILAPEAMALPLAGGLSLATGIPYGVLRKRRYDLPGETVVHAKTGYGEGDLHINDVSPGDRVVVVDDVVSTGSTLTSVLDALAALDVTVQGVLLFVDKGGRAPAVAAQHAVVVRALRTLTVEKGKVRLSKLGHGRP